MKFKYPLQLVKHWACYDLLQKYTDINTLRLIFEIQYIPRKRGDILEIIEHSKDIYRNHTTKYMKSYLPKQIILKFYKNLHYIYLGNENNPRNKVLRYYTNYGSYYNEYWEPRYVKYANSKNEIAKPHTRGTSEHKRIMAKLLSKYVSINNVEKEFKKIQQRETLSDTESDSDSDYKSDSDYNSDYAQDMFNHLL